MIGPFCEGRRCQKTSSHSSYNANRHLKNRSQRLQRISVPQKNLIVQIGHLHRSHANNQSIRYRLGIEILVPTPPRVVVNIEGWFIQAGWPELSCTLYRSFPLMGVPTKLLFCVVQSLELKE